MNCCMMEQMNKVRVPMIKEANKIGIQKVKSKVGDNMVGHQGHTTADQQIPIPSHTNKWWKVWLTKALVVNMSTKFFS